MMNLTYNQDECQYKYKNFAYIRNERVNIIVFSLNCLISVHSASKNPLAFVPRNAKNWGKQNYFEIQSETFSLIVSWALAKP